MKLKKVFKRIFKIFRDIYWTLIWVNLMIYHRVEMSGFNIHKNIVTISEASKKDIIKHYKLNKEYIKIIPNGVNSKKFNPSNYSNDIRAKFGNNILLYSGLMVHRKRVPILLKAMPYVIEKAPDVHLVLTGKGQFLNDYIELSKKLGIQTNTTFLGFVNDGDLLKFYATSDIYVFPSQLEGFGQVLLEAMASGTPVICADIPPMSEIIENGGLTFKLNNAKDLSEKIIFLLKNKEKLRELGENALKVARQYEWSKIAEKYYNYSKEILKSYHFKKS